MKNRNGFVSNSSSASFVIPKRRLTQAQINALLDYNTSAANTDGWEIYENAEAVEGWTNMNNCAFDEFMKANGMEDVKVDWNEDY